MRDALTLAKRRARRRSRDGGAVMFIVAMTLVVLASVGVYALAAASTEVKMSGNERQNTQTHYLASYGILGTTQAMVDKGGLYVKLMLDPANTELCPLSLPGVTQVTEVAKKGGCRRIPSSELSNDWATKQATVPYGGPVAFTPKQDPGSLGPTPINADIYVEIAAALPSSKAPGYDTGCFCQVTVTSMGMTQPVWAGAPDVTGQFGGEGLEMQRARVVVGPFTPCLCQ